MKFNKSIINFDSAIKLIQNESNFKIDSDELRFASGESRFILKFHYIYESNF